MKERKKETERKNCSYTIKVFRYCLGSDILTVWYITKFPAYVLTGRITPTLKVTRYCLGPGILTDWYITKFPSVCPHWSYNTTLGWRLKSEILAQGELNVNERHHGYYWSLVHTHQLPGRWHLICPFYVSVQGQRSLSAFCIKWQREAYHMPSIHCFTYHLSFSKELNNLKVSYV